MDENLRRIHQSLEHMTEAIEDVILHGSNFFHYIEQAVYEHTSLDPETLTTDECLEREQDSNFLIDELQDLRKATENVMEVYEMLVRRVMNQNHPTLLHRLEMDMKWKIEDLLNKVLDKESQVDCYKFKLEFRRSMSNFPRGL
ncbi:hypothetical protein CEXT_245851 [Caerostris extrusa]|uniref:Uncharacterized protein n=1 Tax=Caerostris extrusa TaxID=172846 RepID=A0AAV4MCS8_CAEEX|nr:hypothetical protein CEXT_245851 [Caerostris extrusa]